MDAVSMKISCCHTYIVGGLLSANISRLEFCPAFLSSTLTSERPRRPQQEGALQVLTT